MTKDKMSLREARKKGELDKFIREHKDDPKGDKDRFDEAMDIMIHPEKLMSTQETSSQGSSGD